MPSLNDRLLALLECPVCLETIEPPILSCTNGHLVCQACHKRLPNCGLCRALFANGPNVLADKVAYELEYPCPNASNGCLKFVRTELMKEHVMNCEFDCRCLVFEFAVVYERKEGTPTGIGTWKVDKCKWMGRRAALRQHVLDKHGASYVGDAGQLTSSISVDQLKVNKSAKLVTLDGDLFWIIVKFDHSLFRIHEEFVGRIIHLSPAEKSREFYFKFKFPPKDLTTKGCKHRELSPKITFRGRVVSDKADEEEQKRETLVLPASFVRSLATHSAMINFSVEIRPFVDD